MNIFRNQPSLIGIILFYMLLVCLTTKFQCSVVLLFYEWRSRVAFKKKKKKKMLLQLEKKQTVLLGIYLVCISCVRGLPVCSSQELATWNCLIFLTFVVLCSVAEIKRTGLGKHLHGFKRSLVGNAYPLFAHFNAVVFVVRAVTWNCITCLNHLLKV